jgi:hypothetical protein
VSKVFSSDKIEGFLEINPGETRIVTYENDKLAVYKDENSNISAVNPACFDGISFCDTIVSASCADLLFPDKIDLINNDFINEKHRFQICHRGF